MKLISYYVVFLKLYENTSVCMGQKELRISELWEMGISWHICIRKYCVAIKIDTVGEHLEQLELSYIAGRNVNGCNHFGDWCFLLKLKVYIPYDLAIAFLSINQPKSTHMFTKRLLRDVCSSYSCPNLETPRCLSTVEWTNKLWYICTKEYYRAINVNELCYLWQYE